MTPTTAAPAALLTAEEYMALPDDGRWTELVKGRVVDVPPPSSEHCYVCNNFAFELTSYVRARDLGRVSTNDGGVVTERGPDSVRGMDVAYHSFTRVPRDQRPRRGYWPTPELIVEVKSPSNTHQQLADKAAEYLAAGALVVLVADPETESVAVHTPNELPVRLSNGDELTLPTLFPDFRVPVRAFFA